MIDTPRIRIFLPKLPPAQAVHYTEEADLPAITQWIAYLRAHNRVPNSVRTTLLEPTPGASPGAARLVVTASTGDSDRGEILRLGHSLVLHCGQLMVLDTDVLYEQFEELPDPLPGHLYACTT